jgi:hypothetical protein
MAKYEEPNVIDFFTGKPFQDLQQERIIRLSPEIDGLCMLYSNQKNPGKYFAVKLLCWGLRWSGEAVGMVPWLDGVKPCDDIQDPLNGRFEGYYDPEIDSIFFEAPVHKIVELETALAYFEMEEDSQPNETVIQRIPDSIGTHAVLMDENVQQMTLSEINCWQLKASGRIEGLIIDQDNINDTPILMYDENLYPVNAHSDFRYFFQHNIANQIKREDPEALAALKGLFDA